MSTKQIPKEKVSTEYQTESGSSNKVGYINLFLVVFMSLSSIHFIINGESINALIASLWCILTVIDVFRKDLQSTQDKPVEGDSQ